MIKGCWYITMAHSTYKWWCGGIASNLHESTHSTTQQTFAKYLAQLGAQGRKCARAHFVPMRVVVPYLIIDASPFILYCTSPTFTLLIRYMATYCLPLPVNLAPILVIFCILYIASLGFWIGKKPHFILFATCLL